MNRFLAVAVTLIAITTVCSNAQTYSGAGGPIADDGSHNYYPLLVSGLIPPNIDTAFGLETVCINLTHTWDDDLTISVIAPDGTEFLLAEHNGGDGDNYTNTCFNQSATISINLGSAPFTGTFLPEGSIALANNGQNANGIWYLHILDTYPWADAGTLIDWSLSFGNNPATPFPFSSSKLPLLKITTGGKPIPVEPKIMADLEFIYNGYGQMNHISDSGNIFTGKIGIEQRGHSTASAPKTSYGFETRNADSSEVSITPPCMPAESDWVLLANYRDKSLLRNLYTYRLANMMGQWAPRTLPVDVVLDGEYQGVYLLCEKIKRDKNRVDIRKMNDADTTYPSVSGGYIFKLDWIDAGDIVWESDYPPVNSLAKLNYILEYPKADKLHAAQYKYIKSYVDSLEHVMASPYFDHPQTGWRKYADSRSFMDFIILNELTKNVDAYRLSTFFHKDSAQKIKAGPIWDFDLSWGNADYMDCWYPAGWCLEAQMSYTNQCPFWWMNFAQDSLFMQDLRCRWDSLVAGPLHPSLIKNELDSLYQYLEDPVSLNFTKWPILGLYVWPNPQPIPTTYSGEVQKLKDWTDMRIAWLDANWPGYCPDVSALQNDQTAETPAFVVWPNPTSGLLYGKYNGIISDGHALITLHDVSGKFLWQNTWDGSSAIQLPLWLEAGVYILNLNIGAERHRLRIVHK